jgi:hypothetical protein
MPPNHIASRPIPLSYEELERQNAELRIHVLDLQSDLASARRQVCNEMILKAQEEVNERVKKRETSITEAFKTKFDEQLLQQRSLLTLQFEHIRQTMVYQLEKLHRATMQEARSKVQQVYTKEQQHTDKQIYAMAAEIERLKRQIPAQTIRLSSTHEQSAPQSRKRKASV